MVLGDNRANPRSRRSGTLSNILGVFYLSLLFFVGCMTTEMEGPVSDRESSSIDPVPGSSDREEISTLGPIDAASSTAGALDLNRKIGQHLIGWIPREGITPEIAEVVRKGYVGGFILYPWNYENSEDVIRITSQLQQLAGEGAPPIRLLLCADQEGGRVAAFRFRDLTALPPAFYLGAHRDPELIRSAAYIVGVEIRDLGLNMNLAPVLDLHGKPDSTIIGDRSFGSNPDRVAEMAVAYIQGAKKAGVVAVAKHFPGHGGTTVDSHGSLPRFDKNMSDLNARELKPYTATIANGLEAIMTAHILFPQIDSEHPVTLSKIFITNILRRSLGFDGVVMTDGLAMGALAGYELEETLALSLNAGVDLLLVHNKYDIRELNETIEKLILEGRIDPKGFEESLLRVLNLKAKMGLLDAVPPML